MQEVRGEHHVVSLIPELRVVLVVELHHVARSDESEARDDEEGEPEPHEESGVVEGSLGDADDQAGEDGTHDAEGVVDLHPVEVDDLEGAAEGVLRVLALAHLKVPRDFTNQTASLCETLIVDVLEQLETTSLQEP